MNIYFPRSLMRCCLAALALSCLASCTPELKVLVTNPAKLQLEGIQYLSFAAFEDELDQEIPLPGRIDSASLSVRGAHDPAVLQFTSNSTSSDLVRAITVSRLSASNQYRLLNSGGADVIFSGIIPDASAIGVISAKVRHFEQVFESSERRFFTLLATRGGGNLQEQLAFMAARQTSSSIASQTEKGYHLPVPYIEIVSAMEVTFEMIRKSTGEAIVPDQVYRSYYVRKWGGSSERSHLPEQLKAVIVTRFQEDEVERSAFAYQLEQIKTAITDPDEFLARGGRLTVDRSVPRTPLEVRSRLAREIADQFVQQISQTTEEKNLEVAAGDGTAVTFMKGNAFELAINRLETIDRSEADAYNLGLCYESVGEYRQALVYYQEALDKDPGNKSYQEAISRIGR